MDFADLPSRRLTFDDAVEVWKLRAQGWFQNRIAARFDVNPGRVNDVLKGRKHRGSREAALSEPPTQTDLFSTPPNAPNSPSIAG